MFEVVFLLAGLIFVAVFLTTITGFARHARLHGRVFDLVERQLDEAMRRPTAPHSTPPERTCGHCGRAGVTTSECPNCGAPVA
jgi:hypothetical protein